MSERELFAAHGMTYPTFAQIVEGSWTEVVHKPVVVDEQASDHGRAYQGNNQRTEAFA
jgi:hypothetical protein